MNKNILPILLMIFGIANADEQQIKVNNNTSYNLPRVLPSKFNEQISLDRTFTNLNDFTTRLQALTLLSIKIVNTPETQQTNPVKIFQQFGTVTDLLNQAAIKFNVTWTFDSNQNCILFSHTQPNIENNLTEFTRLQEQSVDKSSRVWIISKSDIDLRTALARWCKEAQWQLDWQVQGRFPIDFDWQVQGDFKHAINQVLKASQQSEIPLLATTFEKNKVLRIVSTNK